MIGDGELDGVAGAGVDGVAGAGVAIEDGELDGVVVLEVVEVDGVDSEMDESRVGRRTSGRTSVDLRMDVVCCPNTGGG